MPRLPGTRSQLRSPAHTPWLTPPWRTAPGQAEATLSPQPTRAGDKVA